MLFRLGFGWGLVKVRAMVKVRVKVMFRVQKDLGFDLYRHSDPFIFGRHTVYLRHTHYEMLLALSRASFPAIELHALVEKSYTG